MSRFCKTCGEPATVKSRALLCDAHERERVKLSARNRRAEDPGHGKRYRANNRTRMNSLERKRRRDNIKKSLLLGAKHRAKKFGLPFSITIDDIRVPTSCPLLGTPLVIGIGKQGPQSPTLDRIFNRLGYVPGNVWVISHAANTCKGGLNADAILKIGFNLKFMEQSCAPS